MDDLPLKALSDDDVLHRSRELLDNPEFADWFGDSLVTDEDGLPLVVYHGTDRKFDLFDPMFCRGGIHFGSILQANQRLFGTNFGNFGRRPGARIIPAYLKIENPKRMKEQDSWGEHQLQRVRDSGSDGVVYLNRREGIPFRRFEELRSDGWLMGFGWPKIQKLSDSKFLDLVPEATDSFIVFDADQIMLAEDAWNLLPSVAPSFT